MAEMSDERLAEIRERAESVKTWKAVWGPPIPQLCDGDIPDLVVEVERLRARLAQEEEGTWEAIAEAERIRAMYADLKANGTEIERQRDRLAEQVKRVEALRDRWEAVTRDPSAYGSGGVVHAAALAASHLPDLCRALDGTETEADGA